MGFNRKVTINDEPIDFKNNNILIPELMEFLSGEKSLKNKKFKKNIYSIIIYNVWKKIFEKLWRISWI